MKSLSNAVIINGVSYTINATEAKKVAGYYPTVITMTRDGYSKKEIIKKLGLEDNATSYRKVDKALKFAHDYLTD